MLSRFSQRACCSRFQMRSDLFVGTIVGRDDQMNMMGKNRAGMNNVAAVGYRSGKTARDDQRLYSRKAYRRVVQSVLGIAPKLSIVRCFRDRAMCFNFRRFAETKQFPRGNEFGPGSTRIVREPETVRAEDDVSAEYHVRNRIKADETCIASIIYRNLKSVNRTKSQNPRQFIERIPALPKQRGIGQVVGREGFAIVARNPSDQIRVERVV